MSGSPSAKHLLRFATTGATVFVFDLSMVWMFRQWVKPLIAVSMGYFLGLALHFLLNKLWVFESRSPDSSKQILRYGCSVAACWVCTLIFFSLFHLLVSNILIAKAMAVPPTTLLSFVLLRTFVFPEHESDASD